jgi:hypothetical protein
MGIIYVGKDPNGKCYVGQHNTENFRTRKSGHQYGYFGYLKNRVIRELMIKFEPDRKWFPVRAGCTSLYNGFMKYGMQNFKWFIVKRGLDNKHDLNKWENHFIKYYNSLAPNGYNLKTNTVDDEIQHTTVETKQRMSESSKLKTTVYLQKYRRYQDKLDGVPKHVTYFDSGGIRGYRINGHPKCKHKQFADSHTPTNELKSQLLEFMRGLNDLEQEHKSHHHDKQSIANIPKGISEQKPGRFLVQFRLRGTKYTKFFSQSPRKRALRKATQWMERKKILLEEGSNEDPIVSDSENEE